ncbi:Uncharacterised protein [Vibrio cholerae]|nr:Uncharacterised protein [Vibrio cholerae]CSI01071.1 Uncharacterised protein [Vibrio cholerae]
MLRDQTFLDQFEIFLIRKRQRIALLSRKRFCGRARGFGIRNQ